jgi:hypothetical protein
VGAYLDNALQIIEIVDDTLNSEANSIEQRYEIMQLLK